MLLQTVRNRRQRAAEIAARREEEFEAYEQSLLLDELTDQSERLARPMENGFVYSFGKDGKLYSEYGDQLEEVFTAGRQAAEQFALQQPEDWGFEAVRRRIEEREIQRLQQLQDGEKLITFSPIPDAVREGRTNIRGYDRKRQKMLVRIGERSGDEVAVFSFSLDGSNYKAMQASARAIGADIPDGMGSEDILANAFLFDNEHPFSLKDSHGLIREAYDLEMERQFGGKYYAGRPELNEGDALSFIKQQKDLISQHMKSIKKIKAGALDEETKNELLEKARYNFAAALDAKMHGKEVESIESAGEGARAEGRSFEGDCPPGMTQGQIDKLGFMQGKEGDKKFMTCPYCGKLTFSDVCFPVCNQCGSTPGNDMTKGGESAQKESLIDVIIRWHEESREVRLAQKRAKRAKKLGKEALAQQVSS